MLQGFVSSSFRYFTQPVPGPWHGTNRWAGLRGGADSSGHQRTDAGLSGGSWDVPWEQGAMLEYQEHIQIFHFMFYVDKSRGEFTAVCCALFLSASIISSEPSESPVLPIQAGVRNVMYSTQPEN